MERHPRVDWAGLDKVIPGCANQAGEDNRNVARMAALLAGLPDSVLGVTVNRLCASGIKDRAGALLLASEETAAPFGLTPLARVTGMASAGVPPRTMGLGPAPPSGRSSSARGAGSPTTTSPRVRSFRRRSDSSPLKELRVAAENLRL